MNSYVSYTDANIPEPVLTHNANSTFNYSGALAQLIREELIII